MARFALGGAPIAAFRDGTAPVIEYAHTPHVPHLGTFRVLMAARAEARRRGGVLLFAVNDQVAARELAECRYVPVMVRGVPVAKPPSFGVANARVAMAAVPPPSSDSIDAFAVRWTELEPSRAAAIVAAVAVLRRLAAETADLAAFLVRVWLWLAGAEKDCIVLPTTVLTREPVPAALAGRMKDRFWRHCAACGYRLGRAAEAPAPCAQCGAADSYPVPDVVVRQVLANAAGIAVRVCGAAKPYQTEADALSAALLGRDAPPRLRVTGRVRAAFDDAAGPLDRVSALQAHVRGVALDALADARPDADLTIR